MGVLEIFIGIIAVLLVLVIFMQPISILTDQAETSLTAASGVTKYGTDTEGNVVEVGPSSALSDASTALLYFIGTAILIGFIIWIVRHGRGGVYEYAGYEEIPRRRI